MKPFHGFCYFPLEFAERKVLKSRLGDNNALHAGLLINHPPENRPHSSLQPVSIDGFSRDVLPDRHNKSPLLLPPRAQFYRKKNLPRLHLGCYPAARRRLPFLRRLWRMARPLAVRARLRNPVVFRRFPFLGWYVLFIMSEHLVYPTQTSVSAQLTVKLCGYAR